MAQPAPPFIDIQDVQFKLHDKTLISTASKEFADNVSLLSAASSKGLLFAGNTDIAELKVFMLKNLVETKDNGDELLARVVQIPGVPHVLACSADGNFLAVSFTQQSNCSFLHIYEVNAFLTAHIQPQYSVRLSSEDNVSALQILWNPVLTNNLAVVLSNGALNMYALKDGGNIEMYSLDKTRQVKCGCWSPKGKQLVLGFPNGKLQQFKPDLTPAKTIVCPADVHPQPFNVLALHWLSTYQFAAVFLQEGEDNCPALHIINAPKGGTPSYMNYRDVCFSSNGPRSHQFTLLHIAQWNLLLVVSANGVEVGLLGTKDTDEMPQWRQYVVADDSRIEMPLVDRKYETYPLGIAFDTAATHQVMCGEQKLPFMPMIHVLITSGDLLSYDFLNSAPNAVGICSPPPPISDSSGQYRPMEDLLTESMATAKEVEEPATPTAKTPIAASKTNTNNEKSASSLMPASVSSNATGFFTDFTASSTPNDNAKSVASLQQNLFGKPIVASSTAEASFAAVAPAAATPFLSLAPAAASTQQKAVSIPKTAASHQPLYSVTPVFTPPVPSQTNSTAAVIKNKPIEVSNSSLSADSDYDELCNEINFDLINSFTNEIKTQTEAMCKPLQQLEKIEEMVSFSKRLHEFEALLDEPLHSDVDQELRSTRNSLNENYAMLKVCSLKLEQFKNPDSMRILNSSAVYPHNQRRLEKLRNFVNINQTYLQQINELLDEQWSTYQNKIHRISKRQMHVPCLEGIYQRLGKHQDMLSRQRNLFKHIKSKLSKNNMIYKMVEPYKSSHKSNVSFESLTDTMLSLSFQNVVDTNRSKLSEQKLMNVRNFIKAQKGIRIIKPQRPSGVDLNSEVILEVKLKRERSKALATMQKIQPTTAATMPTVAANAAAEVAQPQMNANSLQASTQKLQQHQQIFTPTSNFNFAPAGSSFIKTTTAATAGTITAAPANFGSGAINLSQPTAKATPISFTPKVLSNDAKILPQPSNSSTDIFSAFSAGNATKPAAVNFGNDKTNSTAATATDAFKFAAPTTKTEAAATTNAFTKSFFSIGDSSSAVTNTTTTVGSVSSTKTTSSTSSTTSGVGLFSGLGNNSTGSALTFSNFGSNIFGSNTTTTPFSFTAAFSATTATNPITASNVTTTAATAMPLLATPATKSIFSDFSLPTKPAVEATSNSMVSSATTTLTETTAATAVSTRESVNVSTTAGSVFSTTTTPTMTKALSSKPAPAVVTTATFATTTTTAATATKTTSLFGNFSANSDATENLFGSLNICQPNTTTTKSTVPSIFSLETPAVPKIDDNFGANLFTPTLAATATATGSTANTPTAVVAATTPTTAATATVVSTVPSIFTPPNVTAVTSSGAINTSATTAAASSAISMFSTPTKTTVTAAATTATTVVTTPSAIATGSIFGSSTAATTTPSPFAATAFGNAAATSPPPSGFFANAAQAVSQKSDNLFANAAVATTPPPNQNIFDTSKSNTLFAANAANPAVGSNIFGGAAAKPEASLFGGTSPATAESTGNLFSGFGIGSSSPPAGTNIFGLAANASGGGGTGFGTGSIFGGSSNNAGNTTGSIFGGGSAASANSGSIFGQNTFGQTNQQQQQSNAGFGLFSSTNAATATTQPSFGSAGSIFAKSNTTNAASGGNLFGGANSNSSFGSTNTGGSTTGSSGFGAFSQPNATSPFGSPTNASPFAQTGASIAQSGFGSPTAQQGNAFGKSVFGGAPSFGSPPTFGSQVSFGGAPTFGSGAKPFGSFNSPTAAVSGGNLFGSPTQQNNLFETLGSTDTGLSFGNLAQSNNPNMQKPAFGGSSFMNYRS